MSESSRPWTVVWVVLAASAGVSQRAWGTGQLALAWLAVLVAVIVGVQVGGYLVSAIG
jgi:hypothetical protein